MVFRCQVIIAAAIVTCGSMGTVAAQPAPALTSLSVVAVASSKLPAGEAIKAGAISTPGDHGGPVLRVKTKEMGYSSWRVAKFQGVALKEYQNSTPILNGRTVVGWYRYWQFNGAFTSGRFTYEARSANAPFQTLSMGLNVR